MEIKQKLFRKIKEESGSSLYVTIGLMTVLITLFLVIFEIFRVINLYDTITVNMERASNIAIEYSMIDEARGYHISTIDADEAELQLNNSFVSYLGLNSGLEKIEDGEVMYKVNFDKYEIDADLPKITLHGTLDINLILIHNYVPIPISLPFDIKTRNVNVVD